MDVELRLASRSPRRADLLRRAGIAFRPGPFPDVDETPPPGVPPAEAARRIARRKARAAAAQAPGAWVLAADTLVCLPGRILGKPRGPEEARRMLHALSGRRHLVVTGVALARGGRLVSGVREAAVTFRDLGDDEIRTYVEGGEPLDKAGAYAIQGRGASFVARLEGERDTVVGLPVALVRQLIVHPGLESPPGGGR